jgi:hypothetical protein
MFGHANGFARIFKHEMAAHAATQKTGRLPDRLGRNRQTD